VESPRFYLSYAKPWTERTIKSEARLLIFKITDALPEGFPSFPTTLIYKPG
jgi:hypothetical protein